jgi:hypothetical protein
MTTNATHSIRIAALAVSLAIVFSGAASAADTIFSAKPIWSSGSRVSGGDGIARFIDVDGDGDLDFATCAPNPKRWVLYRNEGGQLASKPYWESAETTDCDHIDVLDFNKDGLPDLAATHESHCTLYFNGSGKFKTKPDWETGITTDANQIAFGDFDLDGDLDMLMASGNPVNGVALFENTKGRPSRTISRKIGPREYSETAIFGDFDKDGDLDIFASYGRSGKIVVYKNDKGKFGSGTLLYQDRKQPWTQRLYWRDLDGNGECELFSAGGPWGRSGASLQLATKRNSTEMHVVWKSAPNTAFHGFDFGDVDLDGDLDMVAADWGVGGLRGVSVYLSDKGRLPDSPAWSKETSKPGHEVILGDIDGDGDLDLALGCQNQARLYENLVRGAKSR